jgi:hypothetical protein
VQLGDKASGYTGRRQCDQIGRIFAYCVGLFTLGSFSIAEKAQFHREKLRGNFDNRHRSGYILGNISKSLSGHPASMPLILFSTMHNNAY